MWVIKGKNIFFGSVIVGCIFLLFLFPDAAVAGARNGLALTAEVLIPSLFPFMVFSLLLIKTDALHWIEKPLSCITKFLFRSRAALPILLSFIGGFPVGGKLIGEAYKAGRLTVREAEVRISYSVNPGPAFVITAVGMGMLRSIHAGVILFISTTTAAMITGIVFSRCLLKDEVPICPNPQVPISFTNAFVSAVNDGALSMLSVGGFAVFFSAMIYILNDMQLSADLFRALGGMLEVTTGTSLLKEAPLPLLSAAIAFGGMSVHCQVLAGMKNVPVRLWVFYLGRLTHAGVSALITAFMLRLCPITVQTIVSTNNISSVSGFSVPLTLAMMLMSVTMLVSSKESLKK